MKKMITIPEIKPIRLEHHNAFTDLATVECPYCRQEHMHAIDPDVKWAVCYALCCRGDYMIYPK